MTQTAAIGIKAIKIGNYRIEFFVNAKGQLCGKFAKVLTAGKNKGQLKRIESYYFPNEERRQKWATEIVTRIKGRLDEKAKEVNTISEARKNFVSPYKVGQVFYDSWGYEQTNIDFFEIVEVRGKQVGLRGIGQNMVPGSDGFMCERVTPAVGEYTSEVAYKNVQMRTNAKGEVTYHINGKRGWISEYDKGKNGLYQSHYA